MVKGQHEHHPSVKYGVEGVYTFPSFLLKGHAVRDALSRRAAAAAARAESCHVRCHARCHVAANRPATGFRCSSAKYHARCHARYHVAAGHMQLQVSSA